MPMSQFSSPICSSLILLLLNFVPNEVHTSPPPFPQRSTANPLLCTFTDDATGFYASWHSNCSGLINFLVNVRDFPRPDIPIPAFGLHPPMQFGHFWTGIGFKLISTELALIENLPGTHFVSVTPARFEQGRTPVREIGGGILINPRGSFIGQSMLEATFSIDESLLAGGCKEFLFFTALTPIGAPYGAIPFSKTICDVVHTCSRYQCLGEMGSPIGATPISMNPMGMPMSMPMGGRMPPMDYFDADYIGQMPVQAQQQLLAAANAMTNGGGPMMNFGGSGMPYMDPMMMTMANYGQYGTGGIYGHYGDGIYGQYGNGGIYGHYGDGIYGQYGGNGIYGQYVGQYGNGGIYGQYGSSGIYGQYPSSSYYGGGQNSYWPCSPGYSSSYSSLDPSSAYLVQYYGQYDGYGQYGQMLCPPGYLPSTMPQQYSNSLQSNYLMRSPNYWPSSSSMMYPNGHQRWNSLPLISPLEKEAAAKREIAVGGSNSTDSNPSNHNATQIEIALNSSTASIKANSTEFDENFPLFSEPPPQKPTLNTAISPFTNEQIGKRQKRQTSGHSSIDGFNSLEGTAYEGQDQPFQREPPTPASGGRYLALAEWRSKTGQIPPPPQPIWRPIEQGGQNQSQMYWPYRTAIGGADVNGMERAQRDPQQFPSPPQSAFPFPPASANFYDPSKCDGGIDPQWCADYVRQAIKSKPSMIGTAICPFLMESLQKSDHNCCNALQRIGC